MKSTLIIVAGSLIVLTLAANVALSQEKKPGTTADTWREALPSTDTSQPVEEVLDPAVPNRSLEDTRKMLLATQQTFMEAIKVRDADTLDQLIATDFSFASTQQSGMINRRRYLKYALTELKLTTFEFEKMTVRLFGRTAILTGELKQKSSVNDVDSSGNSLITEVWVNQAGIWRVVSRHESPLKSQ